ncbi:MAG: dihydrodipicolinate synthase family protein [Candidatus Latescibacteria bacterium]|nr:dihydrodipicolinate synthase family protein [Candidatus Latescibacterota bacterium]
MDAKPMCGVFTILVTPFDGQSRIDEESLRRLVDFNLEAGVHGVGVALGSEVPKLSEGEREQVTRIVVDQVRSQVPVVINTGAAGTDLAVLYSRAAERNGADALMVMPPAAASESVIDYFQAISDAVGIPIFIQDTSSAPVPAGLALQIAQACERVLYIKVERPPTTVSVAETSAKAGDGLTVFGGAGGTYFIEEMRRGSIGTMPGCSQPEAFVEAWNLHQNGDESGAREAFDRQIAPVNRIAGQGMDAFFHVHKEILKQRGVIHEAVVRRPTKPIDETTRGELQQVIDVLYPARRSR